VGTSLFIGSASSKISTQQGSDFVEIKNSRGNEVTVTGKISGFPLYKDGNEVTICSIAAGEIKSGNVVQTTSELKYCLT
jgi:FlaG/FlaF family flagellin (archaellin)